MKFKHVLKGLTTTIIAAALAFWVVGAAANSDAGWWMRTFPGDAQAIVLHWDGDNITLTPGQSGYSELMKVISQAIGKHSGYEGSVVFSEATINRYMQDWRMLEVRYSDPVQIHSRFSITKSRTYLIPLNYTHSNYRRVFSLPDFSTFCISAVNMTPDNSQALQQIAGELAVTYALATDPSSTVALISPTATPESASIETTATIKQTPHVGTQQLNLIDTQLEELRNLPIDEFFVESWFAQIRRDPELITELGLSAAFEMHDDQLTNLSADYLAETQALESGILDILLSYDLDELTSEQARSWRIYRTYMQDLVTGHEFSEYGYLISQFIYSTHYSTEHFFTDIHPITNEQQAEAYLTRLSLIEVKYSQVIDRLKQQEMKGVVLPRFLIQWALRDIRTMVNTNPTNTGYYTAFSDKLGDVSSLSTEKREELLASSETVIAESVLPAYQDLYDVMNGQLDLATDDVGVWKFPNGDRYYAWRLQHYTTTEITASEIHELGLQELDRIHLEMRVIFDKLGYPADESIAELYERVARDGGYIDGSKVKSTYESIIEQAEVAITPVIDRTPEAEVIVIEDRFGGYYVPPAIDGSRPGAFYASTSNRMPWYRMPSLAYHETIPGHHLQIALAQELENPPFQQGSIFTVHAEGWALYAEQLAWELGLYEDDPYGNLGRLQFEAHRAARLVVDTGIHAYQWPYDKAVETLYQATGMPYGNAEYEVARYIVLPGQAVSYKIGMLEILRLRDYAQQELGDSYSVVDFHNAMLGYGSVPLPELAIIIDDYIATAQ